MSLIYFRNLSWSFSAEVITVLLVIFLVGLNSLRKNILMTGLTGTGKTIIIINELNL
jgi:type IV secretory pathway ATPase VirB11/archaellum biosynthesis ATPase